MLQHPCLLVCNIYLFVKIGCSGPSQPLHTSQTSIKEEARFNYCTGDCWKTTLSGHTHISTATRTHAHTQKKQQLTLFVGSFIVSGRPQLQTQFQLVSKHLLTPLSIFKPPALKNILCSSSFFLEQAQYIILFSERSDIVCAHLFHTVVSRQHQPHVLDFTSPTQLVICSRLKLYHMLNMCHTFQTISVNMPERTLKIFVRYPLSF